MRISELLIAMANDLANEDSEVLQLAEYHDVSLEKAAEGLLRAANELRKSAAEIEEIEPEEDLREPSELLKDLTTIAQELDDSGDPVLQKRASVLDEILLTFGRPNGSLEAIKNADDAEIEKLRDKYREQNVDKAWKAPKEALDKQNNREQTEKAVREQVKTYEPLEAPLQSRYCPDHAGVPMMRLADYTYQCALDKKVYNYQSGYTTMKGNKIPGTDVAQQTMDFSFRSQPHSVFDNREQMTQRFASFPEFPDTLVKKSSKEFPEFPEVDLKKKDLNRFPDFPKEALAHCGVCGEEDDNHHKAHDADEYMMADDEMSPEAVRAEYPEAYDKVHADTGMEPDSLSYFKDVNGNLCFEFNRHVIGDKEYSEEYCWDPDEMKWSETAPEMTEAGPNMLELTEEEKAELGI